MTNPTTTQEIHDAHIQAAARRREQLLRDFTVLWEDLVDGDEPLKAQRLLYLAPAAIKDTVPLRQLRERMHYRLRHLGSWDAYRACYTGPTQVIAGDDERAANRGVMKFARAWAESLDKEGPPVDVLAIGIGNGLIERAMLEANQRIRMTITGLDSAVADELATEFPERICWQYCRRDHCDWPVRVPKVICDTDDGCLFDAIAMFEVLEHLPDEEDALRVLHARLKPDGRLLLSTPRADLSCYRGASGYCVQDDWWGHLRAHSGRSLWSLFRSHGFSGEMYAVDFGMTFFSSLYHAPELDAPRAVVRYDPPQGLTTAEWIDDVLALGKNRAARLEVTVVAPRPPEAHEWVYAQGRLLWLSPEEW